MNLEGNDKMPPKNKFSKKEIIDVAFNIAKEYGMDGISIRKVADKVGCSIAPIYVNFKDIDEVKIAVIKKSQEVIKRLIEEQKTGENFLDIGIASIKFAKEYSNLFNDLVLKGNLYMDSNDDFQDILIQEMKEDIELKYFTEEELRLLLTKMKIFQVGLAVMITKDNFIKELTEEKIIELLKSTGRDVILGIKYDKNLI